MIRHQFRPLAPVPVDAWQAVQGQDAGLKDVCAWLRDSRGGLESAIARDGGVLIRGFNALSDAQSFELALSALGATLMDYVGGTEPPWGGSVHADQSLGGRIGAATSLSPPFS